MRYQLPNEDLDALISVTTDEDVENMMDEYDRVAQNHNPRSARLRLFLFTKDDNVSRTNSINSLLDGSANRENWFLDALNSGATLERGRSEASSIVSEVPDYLFGLENSDDVINHQPPPPPPRDLKMRMKPVLNENVSVSDPGSPAPVVSSPFASTSSAAAPIVVPSMPDLPPVKTKPDNPAPVLESKLSGQVDGGYATTVGENMNIEPQPVQQPGFPGQPMWQYVTDPRYPAPPMQQIPVYYVPGPTQPGTPPVQPVQMQTRYVQQYPGQVPVGYHQPVHNPGQLYGGPVRPVVTMDHQYDQTMRVVQSDGMNQQQAYYGVRNPGMVAGYPGMMVPGGDEMQRTGADGKPGRISQSN